jgi:3-hydroxybutyryl-CoA dehydrogenase
VLEGISSQILNEGLGYVRQMLLESIAKAEIGAQQFESALANLAIEHSVQDVCRQADLLIEAVAEEMEMKLELFTIFDKFAKPGAILASSTSSLSIAEMAAMTFCPENCAGMRFVDPAPGIKRLEIVRAPETSDATVDTCIEIGRRMGKDVIVVRELPHSGRT